MGKVGERRREGGVEWGAVVAPGSLPKKLRGGGSGNSRGPQGVLTKHFL